MDIKEVIYTEANIGTVCLNCNFVLYLHMQPNANVKTCDNFKSNDERLNNNV